MYSFFQHTLAAQVSLDGIGIHSGRSVHVTVRPGAADTGIVFVRTDITDRDNAVRATGEAVCETRMETVIRNDAGVKVATIEHLMATFSSLGVDNAVVELDAPEIPIMDGSAAPFLAALDTVGLRRQDAPRRHIEILKTVEVIEGDKRAALSPADRFELAFEIEFDSPAIGAQSVDLAIDEGVFRNELAGCRTFGFLREVEQLRAAGLAQGGTLDNVIVIDGDEVMNPEGLRRPDEFVRHKALDAIGDLYLLGAPIIGRYEASRSGHGLNNALVRKLLAQPDAWRLVTRTEELAQAV